jgi:hypothetical protein
MWYHTLVGHAEFHSSPMASLPQPLEKNLEIMPVATVPARFPVLNAVPARFDAWLNLSHLEKASVFVMVNTSAMTTRNQHFSTHLFDPIVTQKSRTDKGQPYKLESDNR